MQSNKEKVITYFSFNNGAESRLILNHMVPISSQLEVIRAKFNIKSSTIFLSHKNQDINLNDSLIKYNIPPKSVIQISDMPSGRDITLIIEFEEKQIIREVKSHELIHSTFEKICQEEKIFPENYYLIDDNNKLSGSNTQKFSEIISGEEIDIILSLCKKIDIKIIISYKQGENQLSITEEKPRSSQFQEIKQFCSNTLKLRQDSFELFTEEKEILEKDKIFEVLKSDNDEIQIYLLESFMILIKVIGPDVSSPEIILVNKNAIIKESKRLLEKVFKFLNKDLLFIKNGSSLNQSKSWENNNVIMFDTIELSISIAPIIEKKIKLEISVTFLLNKNGNLIPMKEKVDAYATVGDLIINLSEKFSIDQKKQIWTHNEKKLIHSQSLDDQCKSKDYIYIYVTENLIKKDFSFIVQTIKFSRIFQATIDVGENVEQLKESLTDLFQIPKEIQIWHAKEIELKDKISLQSQISPQINQITVTSFNLPARKQSILFLLTFLIPIQSDIAIVDVNQSIKILKDSLTEKFALKAELQTWKYYQNELKDDQIFSAQVSITDPKLHILVERKNIFKEILFKVMHKSQITEIKCNVDLNCKVLKLKANFKNEFNLSTEDQIWFLNNGEIYNDIVLSSCKELDSIIYVRDINENNPFKMKKVLFLITLNTQVKPCEEDIDVSKTVLYLKSAFAIKHNLPYVKQIWTSYVVELQDLQSFEDQIINYSIPITVNEYIETPVIKKIFFQLVEKNEHNNEILEINIGDKVINLKKNLEVKFDIPSNKQLWINKESELNDEKSLCSQSEFENLHFYSYTIIVKCKYEFKVFCEGYETLEFTMYHSTKISEIYKVLAEKFKKSLFELKLQFNDRELLKDQQLSSIETDLKSSQKSCFVLTFRINLRLIFDKVIKECKTERSVTIEELKISIKNLFPQLQNHSILLEIKKKILKDGYTIQHYNIENNEQISIKKLKSVRISTTNIRSKKDMIEEFPASFTILSIKKYFRIRESYEIFFESKALPDDQILDEI